MNRRVRLACVFGLALLSVGALAQDRETKVRGDKTKVEGAGFWIYNDLPKGIAEGRKTGKPLLVVFRCIPCDQCAGFDESLVELDSAVQDLMRRFVCVRIVHANGMDLSLFQFDYDQSWAAFFMNPDKTIYGRYGTRSHQTESHNDVSLPGFRRALEGALAVHRGYPANRATLTAKLGPRAEYATPEAFPWFKGRYGSALDYQGKVVQSCIHCHQVAEGTRLAYRTTGRPLPDSVLYPYPNPKILGLIADPKTASTLAQVTPGSPAEKDGFRAGDEIIGLEGQPILSVADIQWVLHHAGATGKLRAQVRRAGATVALPLTLEAGWRRKDDIAWRASSWDLRRQVLGGFIAQDLTDAERREAGLPNTGMALRVKHVGQYSPHDVAKRAGVQKDDILTGVDGRTERIRESDLLGRLMQEKKPGDRTAFTALRRGQTLQFTITAQ